MEKIALTFEEKFKNVTHIAHTYKLDDHLQHLKNGSVIQNLYNAGKIKDAKYFVKPKFADKITFNNKIVYKAHSTEDYEKVKNACQQYKIVDEFTPFHRGGYLINGFGYQLHNIANSDISDVSIEGPSYASKSQYMPGKTETGQSHPTILLFDNMRIFDGKEEADKKYTVTIQVNDVSSKNVLPPYNPFIFVESDKTRGREVHLVKYPPTDKANPSLLGTGKDVSRPDEGLYYVSIDLMPFALNMPISEFPIPEEGVRIDESYPKFATWVKSNGAQAKDWYKYPKK